MLILVMKTILVKCFVILSSVAVNFLNTRTMGAPHGGLELGFKVSMSARTSPPRRLLHSRCESLTTGVYTRAMGKHRVTDSRS